MNIVSKRVLAGAAVLVAYACANPVDISGDVLLSDPSDFGDAGVFAGASGAASAGNGGDVGGSAGETAQGGTDGSETPAGGTGGSSSGLAGTGGGTGGTAQVGLGGSPGLGGAGGGTGGSVSGGAGGSAPGGAGGGVAAGAGGTGNAQGGTGNAGTGGAATAGAGGGGAEPVFDANACDLDVLTGCEDLTCEQVCPTNDGGSCRTRCEAVITCLATNTDCITEDDPLCGARVQGQPKACTTAVEPAGGATPAPPQNGGSPQPSFVALELVECLCSTPRP